MSAGTLEGNINKILFGAHYCTVQNEDGKDVLLLIKGLSLKDKIFVDYIYSDAFEKAKARGALTRFQLITTYKSRGIWGDEEEKVIESIKSRIGVLENQLNGYGKFSRQYKKTQSLINTYMVALNKELQRKRSLFCVSAEEYGNEAKLNAVISCCTYTETEDRYWATWGDFNNETDTVFVNNIANKIDKLDIFSVQQVRKIARSPIWRFRWNIGKSNIKTLFNNTDLCNLDINQCNLLYWSQVYDSVYEAYEKPSKEIIEDDDALDKWFEEQEKKDKKKTLEETGATGKIKISGNVMRHGEVGIVANPAMNPHAPNIQDIEGLNPELVRKFKRRETEIIKKNNKIKETDLRKGKLARQTIGSKDAVIGKRGFGGHGSKSQTLPGGSIQHGMKGRKGR